MTQWKKVELVDDETGCSNPNTDVTLMDEKEKKTQNPLITLTYLNPNPNLTITLTCP